MRNLIDIIEEAKDGGRPEYDELRYALLVMDAQYIQLNNFVLMSLYGKGKLEKMDKFRYENFCKAQQKALDTDPKVYIGSFDPDLPGRQE